MAGSNSAREGLGFTLAPPGNTLIADLMPTLSSAAFIFALLHFRELLIGSGPHLLCGLWRLCFACILSVGGLFQCKLHVFPFNLFLRTSIGNSIFSLTPPLLGFISLISVVFGGSLHYVHTINNLF